MQTELTPIALSIRQPWASLIILGFKPLENRDWLTHYRGRLAIHAGQGCTQREYQAAMEFALAICPDLVEQATLHYPNLIRGALIGEVTLTDVVSQSASPWFVGKYGWLMDQPQAYPQPIPLKARLGLFRHGCHLQRSITPSEDPLQAS